MCQCFPEYEKKSLGNGHINFSNAKGEEDEKIQNQEVLVFHHGFNK